MKNTENYIVNSLYVITNYPLAFPNNYQLAFIWKHMTFHGYKSCDKKTISWRIFTNTCRTITFSLHYLYGITKELIRDEREIQEKDSLKKTCYSYKSDRVDVE